MQEWRLAKAQRFMAAAEAAFAREDWETAVSRSYYAVYHLVVALLISRGGLRRHRWDHDTVINDFRERFTRRGFLFTGKDADTLAALLEDRLRADYTEEVFTGRRARRHITAAQGLYARLLLAIGRVE